MVELYPPDLLQLLFPKCQQLLYKATHVNRLIVKRSQMPHQAVHIFTVGTKRTVDHCASYYDTHARARTSVDTIRRIIKLLIEMYKA